MIHLLLARFDFQLRYLRALVEGIPEDRMADQPAPGMNHPAWLLGHLAWAADLVPAIAGGSATLPKDWAARFATRTRPSPDRSIYPSGPELMDALAEAHAGAARAAAEVDPGRMADEFPDPAFREIMPTVGDGIVHILTTHESTHAGQLSAWRRAAGLPGARFRAFV